MKFNKYTALLLSCLLIFNFITPMAMAEKATISNESAQKINISLTERAIPESIEKEMKDCIKKYMEQTKLTTYTPTYIC